MIFDLKTTINHAGFAVHHNFSIIAISLRTKGAGLLKKRPDHFDLLRKGGRKQVGEGGRGHLAKMVETVSPQLLTAEKET
jgi:hypothetical protein